MSIQDGQSRGWIHEINDDGLKLLVERDPQKVHMSQGRTLGVMVERRQALGKLEKVKKMNHFVPYELKA
ncbi:hypothetical protein Y032_0135g1934 [Ancylostoma ceylanicum]|uniref:Uncharacterized protein n=1 Tax=Ancylostoma ceylanicum TaxID=53326 RepID=A0A016T5L3_9BILA|nr:hypothetical protein Y032_0135g1934 [Ancylostoma ceylanicum]